MGGSLAMQQSGGFRLLYLILPAMLGYKAIDMFELWVFIINNGRESNLVEGCERLIRCYADSDVILVVYNTIFDIPFFRGSTCKKGEVDA